MPIFPISAMQQFVSMQDLQEHGLSYYKINRLVDTGELKKITRDYYENMKYSGETNDFYAVQAYSGDKGVVCLLSAAAYYGLTTHRPMQIDVALARRSRVPESPSWPYMQFYLFSEQRYATGKHTITQHNNSFMIYDREKTVCDVLFYRNKLGFEPAVEVVRNYMRLPDRNLNRLMQYAESLRLKTTVQRFVEVLL